MICVFFGTLCISKHSILLILRFWQGVTDSRVRLSIKSLHAKEPHPQWSLREVRYPGAVTSASDGDTTLQGCRGRSCVADQLETERDVIRTLHERAPFCHDPKTEFAWLRGSLGVNRVNLILRVHGHTIFEEAGAAKVFDEKRQGSTEQVPLSANNPALDTRWHWWQRDRIRAITHTPVPTACCAPNFSRSAWKCWWKEQLGTFTETLDDSERAAANLTSRRQSLLPRRLCSCTSRPVSGWTSVLTDVERGSM